MKAVVRLTDDWLPLPADLLKALQWHEGDRIQLELTDEGVLLAYMLLKEDNSLDGLYP